jgi:curved DNA-binding protein CbpA
MRPNERLEYYHQVLNLPRGFTMEQLRYNYKALARHLHPDKRNARLSAEQANATFQTLTEAYRALLQEAANNERSFDAMRREAQASTNPPLSTAQNAKLIADAKKGFSLERFNEVFEQDRMKEPVVDAGYAEWMQRHDPDKKLPEAELTANRQLIRYTEPTPVTFSRKGCVQYTELGVDRVDDYSREDATRHGIQYTDYRVAHTTTRLVDEAVAADRVGYKSIEDVRKQRAAISYQMSEADLRNQADKQRSDEEAEQRRQEAQRSYDTRLTAHFERVHRNLLGFAGSATM